jgi:hypothetical protein
MGQSELPAKAMCEETHIHAQRLCATVLAVGKPWGSQKLRANAMSDGQLPGRAASRHVHLYPCMHAPCRIQVLHLRPAKTLIQAAENLRNHSLLDTRPEKGHPTHRWARGPKPSSMSFAQHGSGPRPPCVGCRLRRKHGSRPLRGPAAPFCHNEAAAEAIEAAYINY